MAIGLSQFNVALFHTVNHAFFKALLFLGAGAVIHSFQDDQDVRKMGGLIKILPFIYSTMLVGSLSLMATPYLSGFYSKDLILELATSTYTFSGTYAYVLGTLTAGLTAFYSIRLLSLVFLTVPNGGRFNYENAHESSTLVIIPLSILALFSIGFGYLVSDLLSGMGSDFLGNSIFTHPNNISLIEAEFGMSNQGLILKLLPLIFTLIGAVSAFLYYNFDFIVFYQNGYIGSHCNLENFLNKGEMTNLPYSITKDNMALVERTTILSQGYIGGYCFANKSPIRSIYAFLNGKYYFDVVYNHFIVTNGLKLGYIITNNIDRGAMELVGPFGITKLLTGTGSMLYKLDTGSITTYALYFTIGLLSLLIISLITPIYYHSVFMETGNFMEILSGSMSSSCIRIIFIYIIALIIINIPSED